MDLLTHRDDRLFSCSSVCEIWSMSWDRVLLEGFTDN